MGSKKPLKLIIAGSREFNDYKTLQLGTDWFLYEILGQGFAPDMVEIVSGTALGADRLGERYAIDNGFGIKRFPANWTMHGKSAGFKRNRQMAIYADALIAFPLGKSSGTRDMIKQARGLGLTVRYGQRCAYESISYTDELRQEIEDDNQFMLDEMNYEANLEFIANTAGRTHVDPQTMRVEPIEWFQMLPDEFSSVTKLKKESAS